MSYRNISAKQCKECRKFYHCGWGKEANCPYCEAKKLRNQLRRSQTEIETARIEVKKAANINNDLQTSVYNYKNKLDDCAGEMERKVIALSSANKSLDDSNAKIDALLLAIKAMTETIKK